MTTAHRWTLLACLVLAACGSSNPVWHDVKLPSGKTLQVTRFLLAWGVEHAVRTPADDAFLLEYVGADPAADGPAREAEAREAFELARPTCELWGIPNATVSRFAQPQRKGAYDLYVFKRAADGTWSHRHEVMKVFVND